MHTVALVVGTAVVPAAANSIVIVAWARAGAGTGAPAGAVGGNGSEAGYDYEAGAGAVVLETVIQHGAANLQGVVSLTVLAELRFPPPC